MALAARSDSGALAAMVAASFAASSRSAAAGTTTLTSPTSRARRAPSGCAVSSSSIATRGGTSQGRGAAQGAPRPQRASAIAKVACSAATHRSHICASRKPPPYAAPLTAAITGLAISMLAPRWGAMSAGGTWRPSDAISFRSAPAQKAASPAPVSTSTLASGSASKRRNPSHRPAPTARSMALRASGRLMSSQAVPSVSWYRTGLALPIAIPLGDHRERRAGGDLLPLGDQDGADHAGARCGDVVLHLHRLDHHKERAGVHPLAGLGGDQAHHAGQWRGQRAGRRLGGRRLREPRQLAQRARPERPVDVVDVLYPPYLE